MQFFLLNFKLFIFLFVVVRHLHFAAFGPNLAWCPRFGTAQSSIVTAVNSSVRLLNFFFYENIVPSVVMSYLPDMIDTFLSAVTSFSVDSEI
jgi:hypothetical protein